ncbi:MAG: hypothetical protein CVV25_11035 [Ignavibacteriae bacterium HGW-Ignavibacteriae-4]|jgi:nucleoside 2-deoxyribosyltransferase|nr:MAG: hypothetical protein CVV25_11035 [Ignavibacteriae bacterium HGW-Ignavibacteriae-4]
MEKCFVIQPFDNDKFDKRFEDIFKPAIQNAGLEPYRIDKDLSVRIMIDEIEQNISDSVICFAEITSDNPNVWYELGFAFAKNKDVVMICSDERNDKFPFDIQHRHIIKYSTNSKSDFEDLEDTITRKIKAYMSKTMTAKSISSAPIADREGLKSHEIALLVLAIENQITTEDSILVYQLKNEMNKAGYTDVATSVGIRSLKSSGLIETFKEIDEWNNGQEYLACRLTDLGEQWIMQNQDTLEFKISQQSFTTNEDDDVPF